MTALEVQKCCNDNLCTCLQGFQLKLKYPVGLNRVTDCIKRGLLVSFFKDWGGGVWGRGSPENFEISKPYNSILSILGTKSRTKEHVFHSRKCSFHSTFDLSVTINSYKQ